MGIQNRQYMRRGPDDDDPDSRRDSRSASPMNPVEEFFRRAYRKHPRLYKYLGLGLLLLTIAGVVVAKLAGAGR